MVRQLAFTTSGAGTGGRDGRHVIEDGFGFGAGAARRGEKPTPPRLRDDMRDGEQAPHERTL